MGLKILGRGRGTFKKKILNFFFFIHFERHLPKIIYFSIHSKPGKRFYVLPVNLGRVGLA